MKNTNTLKRIFCLIAVLACAFVGVLSTRPALAIDSYGVGAVPAKPNPDNPRAKSIFIYEQEPGKTVSDGIRVINNSESRKTIAVYPVDSELSSDGAFACKQQVEQRKGVGGWIKLAKSEVTLESRTEEVIPFTMTVPANADVGEQNGCIAIQDMRKNEATGNGIVLSFRSALRVAVMVPGEVTAKLKLEKFTVMQEKKNIKAVPELTNSGNVSIDTEVNVTLKNVFGRQLQQGGGRFPILRDTTSRFNVELKKPFWGGWYKVGGTTAYRPLQTSKQAAALSTPAALPTHTIFVMPEPKALAIELGVMAVMLGAIGFLAWRLIRKHRLGSKAFLYKVVEGDDIVTLAKTYHTKWKLIAQINHIKAPYSLPVGSVIKVPGKRPPAKRSPKPAELPKSED